MYHLSVMTVCLSVCPRAYLQNYMFDLHRILVHVRPSHVRGSALLCRRRCDAVCSGFTDDVMFVHNDQEYATQ